RGRRIRSPAPTMLHQFASVLTRRKRRLSRTPLQPFGDADSARPAPAALRLFRDKQRQVRCGSTPGPRTGLRTPPISELLPLSEVPLDPENLQQPLQHLRLPTRVGRGYAAPVCAASPR